MVGNITKKRTVVLKMFTQKKIDRQGTRNGKTWVN